MATYKVWLTVKDRYGSIKKVESGTINVGLDELTKDELDAIEESLPLETFVTRTDLTNELEEYATDKEVEEAVSEGAAIIRYSKFNE